MGLLDTNFSTVSDKNPRNSDRSTPSGELNIRGLLDAATAIPVVGDLLSGGLAAYDAAKGDYGSAAINAVGLLPFIPSLGGMIKTPVGRIAETARDSNTLADLLQRAGEKAGYVVNRSDSSISPSRYVSFAKAGDEAGDTTRQVRISNHADKYPELSNGIRTSSDPDTGISFEQSVNWLGREGFPTSLSTRYQAIPTWEQKIVEDMKLRNSKNGKLNGLISAWRNMPKATRGDIPTMNDVESGMTAIDLMRRK